MSGPEKHDLIVVGAGPAGLTAALTAESERVDTLVLDSGFQLGGQAATSSKIENYAGFPEGISGPELMGRIVAQSLKFNTEFIGPTRVTELDRTDEGICVRTDDGDEYLGEVVLLGTGVEFKNLKARNMAAYVGNGVHYGPAPQSADFTGKKVVVIGGANSAGQAAVNFSDFDACEVELLIRGESIEDKMSGYLVDKIAQRGNIRVRSNTTVNGVDGNGKLSEVTIQTKGQEPEDLKVDDIFVFIGSIPKTLWLPDGVLRDEKQFVIPGADLPNEAREAFIEATKGRSPFGHETSMPGLFVAGDVRSGTPKRVAVAAGDGAAAVQEIHRFRQK